MKRFILLCASLFGLAACCLTPSQNGKDITSLQDSDTLGPEMQVLISAIQDGIIKVINNDSDEVIGDLYPLELSSVVVDLKGSFDKGDKFKVNLFVVGAGQERTASETTNLVVTLKPPAPSLTSNVSAGALSDRIAELLYAAAVGVQNTRDHPLRLEASEMKLEMAFGLTRKMTGGGEFEVAPIGLDLSGSANSNEVQKITMIFKQPE